MKTDANLAINGGPKSKTTPYSVATRFGTRELECLQQALNQNTLFYGKGNLVKQACELMKSYTGRPYVVPCSSGTAAVHLGLIACGIGPGDEVILTPNTDSGSVIGIMAEGAVPVFCDCDENLQPDVASISARITSRTKAVIVVHLAGYPAPIDAIMDLCRAHNIGVVEDCAQSWGTRLNGRMVGSTGTAGVYSTNDFKHLSTGDGGFVALADPNLYRRVSNYADKHYDRLFDQSRRQAHFGLNYRMSELQGAVAVAQLEKVDAITGRYHELGTRLEQKLKGLRGGRMIDGLPGSHCTYWWSAIQTDPTHLTGSRDEILKALQAEGLSHSAPYYDLLQRPLFQQRVVRPWLDADRCSYPFVQPDGRSYTYDYTPTPNHKRFMETGIHMHIEGGYTDRDIDETAAGVHKVFNAFFKD